MFKQNKKSNRNWYNRGNKECPFSPMVTAYMKGTTPDLYAHAYDTKEWYYEGDLDISNEKIQEYSNLSIHYYSKNDVAKGDYYARLAREAVDIRAKEGFKSRERELPQISSSKYKEYDYPVYNDYDEEHGVEDYPEEESKRYYPTYDFKNYDVYLEYAKTMAFYVPEGWAYDRDWTNNMWRTRPDKYKFRLLVLNYVGGEFYKNFQKIPHIGFAVNAADYVFGQKRSYFMLHTLAFANTVDRTLMNKMEKAIEKNPFNEEEHFDVIYAGYSDDPNLGFWPVTWSDVSGAFEKAGEYVKDRLDQWWRPKEGWGY